MADDQQQDLTPKQRRLLELMLEEKRRSAAEAADDGDAVSIPRRDPDEPPLLSFAQQRLWFIEQFQPGTAAYNIPSGVRLSGPLEAGLFEESLNRTVARHETLRTTFALSGSRPVQQVAPELRVTLPVIDVSALPDGVRETCAQRLVDRLARRSLEMAVTPPWRALLVRLESEEHIFLAVMHHIISDTWTTGVFFREMVGHYRSLADGTPAKLPDVPIQYADYALWQRRELEDGELGRQLEYWRSQFAGAPELLDLPLDWPRPAVPSFRGGRITLRLPDSLTDRLRELCGEQEATLFMGFMGAYQTLLHRVSGQDDVLVGTPMANRTRTELENLIGLFVNTLVLRTRFDGDPSFRDLLDQVRETTLEGLTHHDVPFEKVVEELDLQRDTSRNPLFQALFAFQNVPIPQLVAEGLTLERYEFQESTARLDLELDLQEMPYGFVGWLGYNSDLFDHATAERLSRAFRRLLEAVVEEPDRPLSALPLLDADERHQILAGWNDSVRHYDRRATLHGLFEAQAERTPEAVAVDDGATRLTYGELEAAANRLARLLADRGVGPGVPVAVHLDRGPGMAVALLGILKAGGFYVPLDPSYPAPRMLDVAGDAGLRWAVSQDARLESLSVLADRLDGVVCLDRPACLGDGGAAADLADAYAGTEVLGPDDLAAAPDARPALPTAADLVAYTIFTSGSTGKPKGVVVRHRPVINLIEWVNRRFEVGPRDRLLFVTSLSFDLSVYDLFGILAAGGTVRVATEAELAEPAEVVRLLREDGITFWDSAPAALQRLAPTFPDEPAAQSRLRLVFLSGDWIPVTLPDAVRTAFPAARVVSLGGATEATVWSNWYPVAEVDPQWPSIPYGRPIQNARYHVLDERMEPQPVGVEGDLYIGGEVLADGYLGRPVRTATSFIPDPFAGEIDAAAPGSRLYRTGDRARYLADGNLEFRGRRDQQVKVRGFRIELEEVETVLARHPRVGATAVLAWGDTADRRLVAYVVPQEGEEAPGQGELRSWLGERLPDYMVPSLFTFLDALPVTANGKLDRKALPEPEGERPELESEYVDPEGELERTVAELWKEVLGVDRVGKHDNFFELGGHSLLLTQVHQELAAGVAPELSLVDLFTYPTVASLAAFLGRQQDGASAAEESVERAARRRDSGASARETDVAIVGMALRYPGAVTPERYWSNLRQGIESISFFSMEEVVAAGVDPEMARHPDYVRAEGTVDDVDKFDHGFFGYSDPSEVELVDPQQRVFMECAWEALERAGYDPATYGGTIGVIGGVNISSYLFNTLYDYDPYNVMSSFLTRIGLLVGNQNDYLCTRIAYHFDLSGPAMTVQSACSTATVSMHLAAQSLLRHECDMYIAGGVQIRVPQNMGYLYQEGGFPSPDGHCRSFDARAKGNVHGNGAGVLILKRLSDALADGDHVHAVIKGSAVANDGSVKVGFTAPGVDGQTRVAAEAMAVAGVEADSIGYLEATGTATELGDPIEIEALTRAWRLSTERTGFCPVGSVKSNIGHTDAASGAAAVIKAALSLENEEIPPSLHFETPNPRIDFASSPFFVNTELRPWPRGEAPRRAAVHTYAVGGTNTHVILEEAPPREPSGPGRPWQLLPLSARSSSALHDATRNLAEHLRRHPELPLADVAWTLQVGRRRFPARRTVLCRDRDEALAALENLDAERVTTAAGAPDEARLAFLLPGSGPVPAAAARRLYQDEAPFRTAVERCAAVFAEMPESPLDAVPGTSLAELLSDPDRPAGPRLDEPLLAVFEVAVAALWRAWGIEPKLVAGEGVGEIVAAHLAGALTLGDALALAVARGRALEAGGREALLEVHGDGGAVEELAGDRLRAVLAPGVVRVGVAQKDLEAMLARLDDAGCDAFHLGAAAAPPPADHPAVAAFAGAAAELAVSVPEADLLSSLDAARPGTGELADGARWARHLTAPARLDALLAEVVKDDSRVLLEVGPGSALTAAAALQDGTQERPRLTTLAPEMAPEVASEDADVLPHLLATLGRLWLAGAAVDWPGFAAAEDRRRVPLPTYPFERVRIWAQPNVERGEAMARLDRSGARAPEGRQPLDEWFYAPSWQRSEQPAAATLPGSAAAGEDGAAAGTWLLLGDGDALEAALTRRLGEALAAAGGRLVVCRAGDGDRCGDDGVRTARPGHAGDLEALLDGLDAAPSRIVLLWPLAADGDDPEAAEERCFWTPVLLARTLTARGVADPVALDVVTAGVHEVTGGEELAPARSLALAPAAVIPAELPNFTCRTVDVEPPRSNGGHAEVLAGRLAGELLRPADAPRVALRGRHRWVRSWERLSLPAPEGRPARLREEGVYLLLGGVDGLALLVAERLAATARARLAVVGESGLPRREEWDAWLAEQGDDDPIGRRIAALRRMEEQGAEVLLCEADLGDGAQVEAAVERAVERFGAVHGVVHAAGEQGPEFARGLAEIDPDFLRYRMRSRLGGLPAVERALAAAGREPDFWLLASTVASALGGPSVAADCAVDVYLDALARARSAAGAPWTSVDWDAFRPAGAEGLPGLEDAIEPPEGAEVFDRLLAGAPLPRVVVSTTDLPSRLAAVHRGGDAADGPAGKERPDLANEYVAPRDDTERQIQAIWQDVLGIGEIGVEDNFFDLGGNSLVATQLVSRLRGAFNVDLPLQDFFEGATIADVARSLEVARWVSESGGEAVAVGADEETGEI